MGNIGTPILSVKNINKKTLFVIEASSYQLEYSKIFKSNYAAILNISPDHIERHKTLNQYTKAKFKLLKSQIKGDLAFVKKSDKFINKELKLYNFKSEIIKVNTKSKEKFFEKIKNRYFLNETNKENLSFIYQISKKLNLNKKLLLDVIEKFKGLKYRQQIIYNKNKLTIINDSKSTSFSSTIGVLKANDKYLLVIRRYSKKR